MKKKCTLLILALVLAAGCLTALPAFASEDAAPAAETVTVMGRGLIHVDPDCAELCLGIETRAEDLAAGQRENADIYQNLLRALGETGVDSKCVENEFFNAYPVCEEGKTHYEIHRNLRVKIGDFSRIDELTEKAMAAGANRFNGIRYCLEDTQTAFRAALLKAREDALSKAAVLQSGLRLTDLNEMGVYWYSAPDANGNITVEATLQAVFTAGA